MIFDDLEKLDEFSVEILEDPYQLLMSLFVDRYKTNVLEPYMISTSLGLMQTEILSSSKTQLCLPLYSTRGKYNEKFVAEKSGLNQWNAGGRVRNKNEIYIPYQAVDRKRDISFFPPRDTSFTLHLPDGTEISAKVCQEADKNNKDIGKAIMSNPNKVLGKWLLRDVLELEEGTVITYEMLEKFGIDSVIFTKNSALDYSIDFSEIGTYEKFYANED